MEAVGGVLAVVGVLALLRGVLGAGLRLLRRAAEGYVARELARTRARRGDVTGLSEARAAARAGRAARRRAGLELLLWLTLLAAPALTPWPARLYAACAIIWVLHWSRERRR